MKRWFGLSALLPAAVFVLAAPGQETKKVEKETEAKPQPAPVITLAAQSAKKPASALKFRLLPDPLDEVSGNAAPVWVRAVVAARAVEHKWTDRQHNWSYSSEGGTALKDLPRKELREVLTKYAPALRLAEHAARRSRCDWEWGPLTIQNLMGPDFLPLPEIQGMREITRLLSLRCRLELSEGRFEDAARSIQTGLALARHLNSGDLILQDLVGIAIAQIMLGRVEEWIQLPGSPNLYWALTDLPRPLVDARKSIKHELNTIHRSYPALRQMRTKTFTAGEATKVLTELFSCFQEVVKPVWVGKQSTAAFIKERLPQAKKALLAAGRTEKSLDALPAAQVVALAYIDEYDRHRDDVIKLLGVPSWQAHERLDKLIASLPKAGDKDGNVILAMLLPALTRTYEAQLRAERYVAGLRGAEALRQHAADTGKLPAKWADITLPGPIDPFTGKGLDAFYSVKDGKAVLNVPPPPGKPALLGRRFEVAGKK